MRKLIERISSSVALLSLQHGLIAVGINGRKPVCVSE